MHMTIARSYPTTLFNGNKKKGQCWPLQVFEFRQDLGLIIPFASP